MTMVETLVLAGAAVAIGAVIQGSIGFGLGTFAAPLLAIVEPRLVPAPMLVTALVITVLVAWREREELHLSEVAWALVGRFPGTAAGAVLLILLPRRAIVITLALSVLVAVGASLTRLRVPRNRATLLAAGFASGTMGTATSVGMPPMALLYQDARGGELRGTLSGFSLIGALASLVGLRLVGELGAWELEAGLWLVPPMLLGYSVSGALSRVLDRGWTRHAVLALCAGSSFALLVRELTSR